MAILQEANIKTSKGANYAAVNVGRWQNLDDYKLELPALGRKVSGKLFVREFLGMTGMQISFAKLPAGAAVPFYHAHKQNEEAYIFIGGQGQMQVDGELIEVAEGSIVRVSTQGSRTLRNTGAEPLYYICVQAKENSLTQETFQDGIPSQDPVTWPS